MTVVIQQEHLEMETKLTLHPSCGLCRRFPQDAKRKFSCPERSKPVTRNRNPCRGAYDPLTAEELLAAKIDVKAKQKEYGERPDVKAKQKEYRERPDVKAKQKEYRERPDVKAKKKEYFQRPDVKAKKKEYFQRPDVKAKKKEQRQTKSALKALEKLRSTNPQLYERLLKEVSQ